jgi:hypothetical protein
MTLVAILTELASNLGPCGAFFIPLVADAARGDALPSGLWLTWL